MLQGVGVGAEGNSIPTVNGAEKPLFQTGEGWKHTSGFSSVGIIIHIAYGHSSRHLFPLLSSPDRPSKAASPPHRLTSLAAEIKMDVG